MKQIFISFLLSSFLISHALALDWERVKVTRIIDTEHALLSDGRVIQLIGFDGPDHIFPSLKERGTARRTFRLLKMIFETQSIKILKDSINFQNNIFPRHVKLENGENLVELLITKGLGKFKSQPYNNKFDTKFKRAETIAQNGKVGIWGKSELEKTNEYKRKIAGVMTQKWKKKYGHFLAPISTGRVKSVEQGNKLTLENGLCIRLLGVETPSPLDIRKGQKCFGEQSRNFLNALVLGKQIEFTKDISQLDDRYCLFRHIWLPQVHTSMTSPTHINKEIIEFGFGKASFPKQDEEFNKTFKEIQKYIYQNPKGAWLNCAAQLFEKEEKPIPSIDQNCPIKISKSGKIHTSQSSWYKRLEPIRCFETEEKAHQAGF